MSDGANGDVLCAVSAYEEKYYLNPLFDALPGAIKEELRTMCVTYAVDVGGVLILQFDGEGNLFISAAGEDGDFSFDEIGSGLKIKKMRSEKRKLFESLEAYYKAAVLR